MDWRRGIGCVPLLDELIPDHWKDGREGGMDPSCPLYNFRLSQRRSECAFKFFLL